LQNRWYWLRRNPFKVFVHPTPGVEAPVRAAGLTPQFARKTFAWQVVVYGRAAAA